jgi:hypothetical protein
MEGLLANGRPLDKEKHHKHRQKPSRLTHFDRPRQGYAAS